MTPYAKTRPASVRPRNRAILLGGTALCGAVALLAQSAQGQTLPSIPVPADIKVDAAGALPVITAPDANTRDIDLNASRTVINWGSFHVSGADKVNFHFDQASDIVLNKSPTAVRVDAGGHVTGTVGAATGGNIWFYSPQGVIISPGAVMTAGSFVFGRGSAIDDLLFVADANPLGFLRAAADSLIQVDTLTLATSASIDAAGNVVLSAATGDVDATTLLAAGSATVTATTGSVTLGEVTANGGAVTIQALGGTAKVDSATATDDVIVTGSVAATLTTGDAGRDLKISGPTATLGEGDATRDIFVTGTTGGAVVIDHAKAGDDVEVTATTGSVSAADATLTSTGVGALDDAHVLVRSTGGSVQVGAAETQGATLATRGDVTIDAVSATLGSGVSTRDINLSAGMNATLTSGDAARDINIDGPINATLTGGDAGGDINVIGDTASVGTVTAGGDINVSGVNATLTSGDAGGDVNVMADGVAAVGTGVAGGDINVDGAAASLGSGDAQGSIFVTATAGDATVTNHATAGDDVEVTASGVGALLVPGSVKAAGATLTSTGIGASGDGHVLARSAEGSVDVGAAVTAGTGGAQGDVTIEGHTEARLGSVGAGSNSSRDLFVTGPVAVLGRGIAAGEIKVTGTTSASAGSARAGVGLTITADTASLGSGRTEEGDIIVTAANGNASVTSDASAADDVEITALGVGSVTAGGATLTSRGVNSTDDGHVIARSANHSVSVGAGVTPGSGVAAGDVILEGVTGATLGDGTNAGRDLLVTTVSGNVAVGSARAGDDIVLLALAGSVSSSGDVMAGQTTTASDLHGAADDAFGTMVGHDLNVKAFTVNMRGGLAAGRTPGLGDVLDAAQLDSDVTVIATAGDPTPGLAALQVATDPGKAVTAHRDIDLHTIAAGASIRTGGLRAGRDAAVYSPTGAMALGSAQAGDDVVLRAPLGSITVTGDVKAGRDLPGMTATDAPGVGDALNAALPFRDFDGSPATVFSVVGFDVNIIGQQIRVDGATIAGRQPSTDDPNGVGPIDESTSDVRIETLVSATTPTIGLSPDITLGSVMATRDVQIDSFKAVTTGALQAGRDIAVLGRGGATPGSAPGDHSDAGVNIGSAHAGDDAVIFSIFGHANVAGDVISGQPFDLLSPTGDRLIDGATEAADQLAIYLHYFDLDEASSPYVINSGMLLLRGEGVTVGGNLTAMGAGSDIRLRSTGDISVNGNAEAGGAGEGFYATGDAIFRTDATTGATLSLQDVRAAGNVIVDAGGAGTTNIVTAQQLDAVNSDVAVRGNSVTVIGATAGDDVVLRGATIEVGGAVTAGTGGADSLGAGDALVISDGAIDFGGLYSVTGRHDVDIKATADMNGQGSLTANGAGSDVRVQAGGAITMADATAARDVLVDARVGVETGQLDAGRDVAVRSRDGDAVTVGGADAGDDVVIRTTGHVSTTGLVSAGGGLDQAGVGDTLLASNGAIAVEGVTFGLGGHNVDIKAGSVGAGALEADADVRVQAAGAVGVGNADAGRDVLVDGGANVTTGQLGAGRDVGVRSLGAGSTVDVGGASAGDDVVIRGRGDVKAGALTAHGANSTEAGQAGDLMFGTNRTKLNGDLALAGQNVDVRSTGGGIDVTGAATADTDARFQTEKVTGGSVKVAAVTAGGNVLLDGAGVTASGALTSTSGDVAVRARSGGATLADVSAGDDVAIRAQGPVIAGSLSTHGQNTAAGLGDRLIADSGAMSVAGRSFDLSGSDVDVVSGSADIGSAGASGDVRILAGGGGVHLGSATAGRDVLIDAAGSVDTGGLSAGGDVGVRSTGGSLSIDNATAGDDVVLRAGGSISAGSLKAGGGGDAGGAGDLFFSADPTALRGGFNLGGGNIDAKANGGSVAVGSASAGADIRLQASGDARISADAIAGRDILLDGAGVASTGVLRAGGDIALFGRSGNVAVGSAAAGDDVVIRAAGAVTASGTLSSGSVGESDGMGDRLAAEAGALTVAGVALDLNGGTIDIRGGGVTVNGALTADGAAGNVRIQSGGALAIGKATATGDILLDAVGEVTADGLSAGRDIGVRSAGAGLTIASATAGDDIVLRAAQNISVTGGLTARGGADAAGVGDLMSSGDGVDLAGGFDLAGSTIDLRTRGGAISALGGLTAGGDVRLQAAGPTGGVATGDVTAGRDILLDGDTVSAAALRAERDIAVRSRTGSIALASAAAGDDLVLRAAGPINVAGAASAQGGADGDGAGDRLFGTDRTKLNGEFDLAGSNLDARSSGGAIVLGGAASAGRDVRLQTAGSGEVTTAAVTAGRDILADASSVRAGGQFIAGGDIALRGRTGAVEVASLTAGDDIAVRAVGAFSASGALSSGSAPSSTETGAADRLISASESGMILRLVDPAAARTADSIKGFTLTGGDIDVRSGGAISVGGAVSAGRPDFSVRSSVRLQSPGKVSLAAVSTDGAIFVRSADIAMGGTWKATTARIESTAAGGVALGSDVTAAGAMALSNDQINLIDAATLQIFAGDTSGTMRGGALSIGNLSIDVAKVKTALELYAGALADVRITGTFAPSTGAANTTAVRIGAPIADGGDWTPKSIKVIADNGGSIGFSTMTDGRTFNGVRAFGLLELNAKTDILMGYQDFIDKMSVTEAADVFNVVKTFRAAQGPNGARMLVTVGGLTLRADGKVASQDTSAVAALTRTGIFLTGAGAGPVDTPLLTLGRATPGAAGTPTMPQYIELYGAVKFNVTVLANENVALSNLIAFGSGVSPSQYYRLNTCVIFQTGNCTPSGGLPNTNISADRLSVLNLLDRSNAAGAADPTVASATNEEIWKAPE